MSIYYVLRQYVRLCINMYYYYYHISSSLLLLLLLLILLLPPPLPYMLLLLLLLLFSSKCYFIHTHTYFTWYLLWVCAGGIIAICWCWCDYCRASREEMAVAATSPTQIQVGGPGGGQMPMSTDPNITLMEDPDVWRPT